MGEEIWCAAGFTYSQQLAEAANRTKTQKTFEEMVPSPYRHHAKVFSEKESERLPEHKPWDHAIDLKPDTPETIRTKIYPMSVNEQEELDRFLEENLRKGYIRPSKSPLSSPVFFVKRRTGNYGLYKTIENSMSTLSKTGIRCHWLRILLTGCETPSTSPNAIYAGDTTTLGLKKAMNGREHLPLIGDSSSPL